MTKYHFPPNHEIQKHDKISIFLPIYLIFIPISTQMNQFKKVMIYLYMYKTESIVVVNCIKTMKKGVEMKKK